MWRHAVWPVCPWITKHRALPDTGRYRSTLNKVTEARPCRGILPTGRTGLTRGLPVAALSGALSGFVARVRSFPGLGAKGIAERFGERHALAFIAFLIALAVDVAFRLWRHYIMRDNAARIMLPKILHRYVQRTNPNAPPRHDPPALAHVADADPAGRAGAAVRPGMGLRARRSCDMRGCAQPWGTQGTRPGACPDLFQPHGRPDPARGFSPMALHRPRRWRFAPDHIQNSAP